VVASALVVLDGRKVDPRSIHASADFSPFKIVSTQAQARSSGPIATRRTTWTLLCLDPGCLPGAEHVFSWTPVDIRSRLHGSSVQRELTVPFEPVTMLTRL